MKPPRLILRLLELLIPRDQHDEVVGDLIEIHPQRVRRFGRGGAAVVAVFDSLFTALLLALHRLIDSLREVRFSLSEFRIGFRLMRRQPIATLTSALSLAVGIGLAAGASSVVREVLFGELPFRDGDRFSLVSARAAQTATPTPIDFERLDAFRTSANAFTYLGGMQAGTYNLVNTDGSVEPVSGAEITPGLFAHLPIPPLLGRGFAQGDGDGGAARVALIRESLWQRRFDGENSVLGTAIELGGEEYEVVGIMPDELTFPNDGEVWLPIAEVTLGALDQRAPIESTVLGILAPGASADAAVDQLNVISDQVVASSAGAEPLRFQVTPMARLLVIPQVQAVSFVALFVLVALLLIASANVANLVVARTSQRSAEIAVRSALGASRSRIVAQLLSETLALAVVAGGLGLLVASRLLRFYDEALDEIPFWIQFELDLATVAAVMVLTLLATIAIGLVPALRATARPAADTLRAAGSSASLRVSRMGGLMISVEMALAVGLIGTAMVYAQGFRSYVDPSVELPAGVLTAQIVPNRPTAGTPDEIGDSIARIVGAVERSVGQLPGTEAVGTAVTLPGGSGRLARIVQESSVVPEATGLTATVVEAGIGLLTVLDVNVLSGRFLGAPDSERGASPVAVVDESFARARWGSADAVGRRVRIQSPRELDDGGPWIEIVGVVPDVMDVTGNARGGTLFRPLRDPYYFQVAWRTDGNPVSRTSELRRAIYQVDPDLEVTRVDLLENFGRENRVALLALSSTMSGVGVLAVLLALAGIYSIVSLTVSRRTREIGIRVALGATPRDIFLSVVRRALRLVAAGSVVGVGLGLLFMNSRDLLTFVLPELTPWLFPSVAVGMLLAGVVAAWLPARRALAIRPVEAINRE